MTVENNKISVLLGSLDFNSDVGQKTLIVAKSAQEVEDVFKVRRQLYQMCIYIYIYILNASHTRRATMVNADAYADEAADSLLLLMLMLMPMLMHLFMLLMVNALCLVPNAYCILRDA